MCSAAYDPKVCSPALPNFVVHYETYPPLCNFKLSGNVEKSTSSVKTHNGIILFSTSLLSLPFPDSEIAINISPNLARLTGLKCASALLRLFGLKPCLSAVLTIVCKWSTFPKHVDITLTGFAPWFTSYAD